MIETCRGYLKAEDVPAEGPYDIPPCPRPARRDGLCLPHDVEQQRDLANAQLGTRRNPLTGTA